MKTKPTWVTKDGRQLLISEMSDNHLKNSIAFLERAYAALCWQWAMAADAYACSSSTPDGAAMCAEGEASALMVEAEEQTRITEEYPIYAELVAEQGKRDTLAKKQVLCECPGCGETPTLKTWGSDHEEGPGPGYLWYRVECECGFRSKEFAYSRGKQQAIDHWNKRV